MARAASQRSFSNLLSELKSRARNHTVSGRTPPGGEARGCAAYASLKFTRSRLSRVLYSAALCATDTDHCADFLWKSLEKTPSKIAMTRNTRTKKQNTAYSRRNEAILHHFQCITVLQHLALLATSFAPGTAKFDSPSRSTSHVPLLHRHV